MNHYADTSFLVALYVNDIHSINADQWRLSHPEPLPLTRFHRVELRNALALCVYQSRLTKQQADAAWSDVESDVQAGSLIEPVLDWLDVMIKSESLAASLTPTNGSRTLDVIHVGTALALGIGSLVSFDARQNKLAQQAGLVVFTTTIP